MADPFPAVNPPTGVATQRYWTIEPPVAEPTGEGEYHW